MTEPGYASAYGVGPPVGPQEIFIIVLAGLNQEAGPAMVDLKFEGVGQPVPVARTSLEKHSSLFVLQYFTNVVSLPELALCAKQTAIRSASTCLADKIQPSKAIILKRRAFLLS